MFNYLTFTCIPEKVPGFWLGCFVFNFFLSRKYSLNGLELKLFGLQNTLWERNCPPSSTVIDPSKVVCSELCNKERVILNHFFVLLAHRTRADLW